jgi:prepilin-type N-terminal cleavage/methylation domain-containing protein
MNRRRGFTLIEIMISVAILAILIAGIYSVMASSQNLYSAGMTRSEIQERVRRALAEVAEELRQANSGSFVPITFGTVGAPADDSVTFQTCTGFAGGVATWSAPILFTTITSDGETDNGLDDNFNKLVDERKLVRTQGARTRVLADNVQQGSLRFTPTTVAGLVTSVRVELTIEGVDDKGRILTATDRVTVELRNQ